MGLFSRHLPGSLSVDVIADRIAAPLVARYGGEEEDEEPEGDEDIEETEDEDDVDVEAEDEDEDLEEDFEEVLPDGSVSPASKAAAKKAADKAKAKAKKPKKKAKKKKKLTCEQMRNKVHTCTSRLWGYPLGSAARTKWQKKADAYKKKMADAG